MLTGGYHSGQRRAASGESAARHLATVPPRAKGEMRDEHFLCAFAPEGKSPDMAGGRLASSQSGAGKRSKAEVHDGQTRSLSRALCRRPHGGSVLAPQQRREAASGSVGNKQNEWTSVKRVSRVKTRALVRESRH